MVSKVLKHTVRALLALALATASVASHAAAYDPVLMLRNAGNNGNEQVIPSPSKLEPVLWVYDASQSPKVTFFSLGSRLSVSSGVLNANAAAWADVTGKPSTLSGYGISDAYPLSGNPAGYLTGISSGQVTAALGFTPYSASNPSGFITSSALSPYLESSTAASTYATQSSVVSGLAGKFDAPAGTTSQYLRGDGSAATFPSIPAAQVNADWNATTGVAQLLNRPNLSNVATSGTYSDLVGRPTLGTAAELDVAASGNASAGQVVRGADTRLTDARTPTAHTHSASDITSGTLADARIPAIAISKTTGLQTALDAKLTIPSGTTSQVVLGNGTLGTLPGAVTLGSLNSRSISLATAYQCTDNTKPCRLVITLQCPLTTFLTGSSTCAGEVRVGTANTVASGASGVVVGPINRSISGVSTLLSFTNGDYETKSIDLAAGEYFAVRQTNSQGGTLTVPAAYERSISH